MHRGTPLHHILDILMHVTMQFAAWMDVFWKNMGNMKFQSMRVPSLSSSPCLVPHTHCWPAHCGLWWPLWYLSISWAQPMACTYLFSLQKRPIFMTRQASNKFYLELLSLTRLCYPAVVAYQHAVDPEPGTCSHCHRSRVHPGHPRVPGVGSIFLRLHLQSVSASCSDVSARLWLFKAPLDTLSGFASNSPHRFPSTCPTVALMAVVMLYFVDYLKGKRSLELWILLLHNFSFLCFDFFTVSFFFFSSQPSHFSVLLTSLHFILPLLSTLCSLSLHSLTT